MRRLRDLIGRNTLFPALRVMRAQMRLVSDPLKLRAAAARVDALGVPAAGLHATPVQAGTVPATWIDVKGGRRDRVLLYLHGGAFITETPVFHGALLGRLCAAAGARGLMISYRLAPEHRYPAALDDCLEAYRWLLAQGLDAARVVVAGDSAGGNLTLALLLRLRDEGLPLPAGAVALSPVADLSFSGESVQRNDGIDDMFSADLLDALVPVYLPERDLCRHPHVSPVYADCAGLPPLLLVVGSTELLLDDSVRMAQRWPGATLLVWHGMPHVFAGFDFLPEAREATQRIGRFVRDALSRAAASQAAAQETAEPADDAEADAVELPRLRVPRRLGAAARFYLAVALASGALWLAVIGVGVGPLLLLVHPLVWLSALALAVVWLGAVVLFVRALTRRRIAANRPGT